MTKVRERRRQAVKREILAEAWAQADEVGIAAISLRELAEAVGMRAPSLYTYFASKDAIYDAMFAEGYEELLSAVGALDLEVAGGDPLDAVAAAIERYVQFCQARPARYQLMFTMAIPQWRPSPEAYAVSQRAYRKMAAVLAKAGVTDERSVDLFTAVTSGLAAQQMANDPGGNRWRRLARDTAVMFMAHIKQGGDDPR